MDFFSICNCQAWALMLLRMVLGSTFIAHGCQKVFGWFGGPGIYGFAGWIASMGLPEWMGYAAALFELIGGLMMFLGIAAEVGALLTIPVMVTAILLVHGAHGYFLQNNGCEYALNLVLLAIVVILGGPGKGALWDPFNKIRG